MKIKKICAKICEIRTHFLKKIIKMPFYDGIGMISEKHAVVLDVGSAYTKVGYAGEAVPRL